MNRTKSAKFTVSVKAATQQRLEKLARIAGRSSCFIATAAVSEYLDVNEAQLSSMKEAITSLDRREAISHE